MSDDRERAIDRAIGFACSLDDRELAERRIEWRALEGALVETVHAPGRMTVRYRGDAATARALEALVAAERECCPDFDWRLEHAGDEIRLEVVYPDGTPADPTAPGTGSA